MVLCELVIWGPVWYNITAISDSELKGVCAMSNKRDSKGRVLRKGESQRKDGMYEYRYTDANGDRKSVYSWKLVASDSVPNGKKQKPPLRELEKQIQKDLEDGVRSGDARNITLNNRFEAFMALRVDLRGSTRDGYKRLYNIHVRDFIGSRPIGDIKFSDIQKLYMHMLTEENLSIGTVKCVQAFLVQVFEAAVMDSLIRSNPTRHVVRSINRLCRTESKVMRALTIKEQEAFINFVYNSQRFKQWGPLFTVMLGTGMRIGEAISLTWDDCDFDHGVISVNHTLSHCHNDDGVRMAVITPPKTKSSVRTIPMLNDVRDALLVLREKSKEKNKPNPKVGNYSGFVFVGGRGAILGQGAVFGVLKSIINTYNAEEEERAKKEGDEPFLLPNFGPHVLRHTFCTRFCENESDIKVIQEIMGHKDIGMTMNIYNTATKERVANSFTNLEGMIKIV